MESQATDYSHGDSQSRTTVRRNGDLCRFTSAAQGTETLDLIINPIALALAAALSSELPRHPAGKMISATNSAQDWNQLSQAHGQIWQAGSGDVNQPVAAVARGNAISKSISN